MTLINVKTKNSIIQRIIDADLGEKIETVELIINGKSVFVLAESPGQEVRDLKIDFIL